MSRAAITIVMLAVLLVASNAWWAYKSVDFGITHTYAMASCDVDRELSKVYAAILPLVADPKADRVSILSAAVRATESKTEPFEKDGYIWVGHAGIKFSEAGRVVGVSDGW